MFGCFTGQHITSTEALVECHTWMDERAGYDSLKGMVLVLQSRSVSTL